MARNEDEAAFEAFVVTCYRRLLRTAYLGERPAAQPPDQAGPDGLHA